MKRFCPDDAYPMERDPEGEVWVCTNPWHPLHPGPCPKCGSTGHHKASSLGEAEVVCASCGHLWPGPVGA